MELKTIARLARENECETEYRGIGSSWLVQGSGKWEESGGDVSTVRVKFQ